MPKLDGGRNYATCTVDGERKLCRTHTQVERRAKGGEDAECTNRSYAMYMYHRTDKYVRGT